jgi:WD40 repeat protein
MLAGLRVAHAAGVVHRDIKPSNVLLEDERVVVTDFGVAAIDGGTTLTQTGALLGTPAFMAPEQARGRPAAPASDLWSLGATLYATVEGHPPFPGESTTAVIAALLYTDPPPPEHAGPLAPVINGLLVKDPDKRMSAGEVAAHLTRIANGHNAVPLSPPAHIPKSQVPAPPMGKAWETTFGGAPLGHPIVRWLRRSRVRTLTVVAGAVLLAAAGLSIPQLYRPHARSSTAPTPTPSLTTAVRIGQHFPSVTLVTGTSTFSVAFSPDGKKLTTGSADSILRWWDVASRAHGQELAPHTSSMFQVAYSPGGEQFVTACADNTVRLWNAVSDTQTAVLTGHKGQVSSVAFNHDGKTLASGSKDGTIRLWDATSSSMTGVINGHMGQVISVAFSPDGRTLAAGGSKDGAIRLWNVTSRTLIGLFRGHDKAVTTVAFSRDGTTLASGSWDTSVRLWDVASRAETKALAGHTGPLNSVVFSPDGKTLASAGEDDRVLLWDVTGRTRIAALTGHVGNIDSVAFSPDGKTLASGAEDRTIRLWDLTR